MKSKLQLEFEGTHKHTQTDTSGSNPARSEASAPKRSRVWKSLAIPTEDTYYHSVGTFDEKVAATSRAATRFAGTGDTHIDTDTETHRHNKHKQQREKRIEAPCYPGLA